MSDPDKRPNGQRQPPPPPQQQQQPDEQDAIPLLQSLAPSIFVPIEDDLIATPFVPPADAAARLTAVLAALDAHAAHVRSNMLDLVRRECVRILREVTAAEASISNGSGSGSNEQQHAPQRQRPEGDIPSMIANMHAPPDFGIDYSTAEIPLPDFSRVQPTSLREEATRDLMASVSRALSELRGFDAHIAGKRALQEQALMREVESQTQ